jgi:hypothetical protein
MKALSGLFLGLVIVAAAMSGAMLFSIDTPTYWQNLRDEGAAAARAGKLATDNPYTRSWDPDDAYHWDEGYGAEKQKLSHK